MEDDALHEKLLGSGLDGTAHLLSCGQDQWIRKTYNAWPPPHGNHLKIIDPFVAELEAYRRIASCPNLHGWVPSFLGHEERSIHMGYIVGERFDHIRSELTIQELRELWEQLEAALEMLHSIGVAHGDCQPHNIIVNRSISPPEASLIDFSRATFQDTTSDWDRAMRKDLNCLKGEFDELLGIQYCGMILGTLRERRLGAGYSVNELAKQLRWSTPKPELLETLITDEVLEPLCILGMAQNLYNSCYRHKTLSFLNSHLPRLAIHSKNWQSPINQRAYFMLLAYKAIASGDNDCLHYLPTAIKLCERDLGRYDPFTFELRVRFALRSFRTGQAHSLSSTLLKELSEHTLRTIPEKERHLLTESKSQEDLIGSVRRTLAIAERYFEQSAEVLMSEFGQQECTASCSHHADFAAQMTTASSDFSDELAGEWMDAPALSFSTSVDDADSRPTTPTEFVGVGKQTEIFGPESKDGTLTSCSDQSIIFNARTHDLCNVD